MRSARSTDRPAYERFRGEGFEIGSGRVEAARKHVVAVRMKHGGMRWSKAGSQNVLSLRVARLNDDWSGVWDARPLARAAQVLPLILTATQPTLILTRVSI